MESKLTYQGKSIDDKDVSVWIYENVSSKKEKSNDSQYRRTE